MLQSDWLKHLSMVLTYTSSSCTQRSTDDTRKSLSLQLQLMTSIYLPIYVPIYVAICVSIFIPIYVPIYVPIYIPIYVHPLKCTVTRAYINCYI